MTPKIVNKLVTIALINYILLIVYIFVNMYVDCGMSLCLKWPIMPHNCYTLLSSILVHFKFNHLFYNLIVFNIFGILSLFNDDDWHHLIIVLIVAGIIGNLGHLFLSPRGMSGSSGGFSGCIMGFMVYVALSYRKHCVIQLVLFGFLAMIISNNYIELYIFHHNVAVDAHIWGAIGGLTYRILYNISIDIYNQFNTIFYLKR